MCNQVKNLKEFGTVEEIDLGNIIKSLIIDTFMQNQYDMRVACQISGERIDSQIVLEKYVSSLKK